AERQDLGHGRGAGGHRARHGRLRRRPGRDQGPVRDPGPPVLLDRPAVGRRGDRPEGHPDGPRSRPVGRGQRTAGRPGLRRLPDVRMSMFDTVLVANRGEIACRVIRTLRRLGIRSVAVYTEPDAGAPHVALADLAVYLGPASAYLSAEAVVDAARRAGAQAVHPGYGFLSENTAFAAACERAGVTFIGPPASAIEAMGDKIRAKQTVAKAGVPVVPGSDEQDSGGSGLDDEALARAVAEIGYPVLLKPS